MRRLINEQMLDRLGKTLFWIGVLIELVIVMVDKSAYINPWEGQLFRLAFLLFAAKIIMTKYSAREWICIFAAGAVAACSYFINTRDEAVRVVVFIAACKDIELKDILKAAFGITLFGTIVLFVLSAAGIFGALKITANFGRGGLIETRYCFGMGHPNAFHTMLLMLTMLTLYIWADKLKVVHFILLGFINYVAFYYTDSKTGFLVTTMLLIGAALLKYCIFLRESRYMYIVSVMLLIVAVAFSIYGSHVGDADNSFMSVVDAFINGRFKTAYAIEASRVENWKFFGDAVNTEYFDAGFVRLFYWYGIIPGVSYILMNLYLIYQSYKNRDYMMLVTVVVFAVFSIVEAHLISVYLLRNYLFVMMGCCWCQPFKERQDCAGYLWQPKDYCSGRT